MDEYDNRDMNKVFIDKKNEKIEWLLWILLRKKSWCKQELIRKKKIHVR